MLFPGSGTFRDESRIVDHGGGAEESLLDAVTVCVANPHFPKGSLCLLGGGAIGRRRATI